MYKSGISILNKLLIFEIKKSVYLNTNNCPTLYVIAMPNKNLDLLLYICLDI